MHSRCLPPPININGTILIMFNFKYFVAVAMVAAVAGLVGGGFYGNVPIAEAVPGVGWVDDGTVVRLDADTDNVGVGTTTPGSNKISVDGNAQILGNLSIIGNISLTGLIDGFDISSSAPSWDSAFNQRNRWDGGSDGLTASTGRTSLGLGSLATANSVSGGSGGTISDNSVTNDDLATSTFAKITGVGVLNHVILDDTDGSDCHKITVNSAGTLSATLVNCITGEPPVSPFVSDDFDSSSSTLTGNNYGLGWGGAWQAGATASFNVATSGCYSGNCIKGSGALEMDNIRTFSESITDGTLSFKTKSVIGSGVSSGLQAKIAGGNVAFVVQATNSGGDIIRLIGASTVNLITSYTSGTWYSIDVEFGDNGGSGACAANQARARIDGGSWSSCVNYTNNGALTSLTPQYSNNSGTEYWVDSIAFAE